MIPTTEQVPTHVKIFQYPFRVSIPQREIYSELDNEIFGIPTTGDFNQDRELANEMTAVTMTIADVSKIWDRGVAIHFNSVDDIARMYEYINEHLRAWERALREKVWMREPPMEDLYLLDRFASFLFTRSRGRIARKYENESLLGDLDRGSVSPISLAQANPVATVADQIRTSEHEALAGRLEAGLSRRTKPWQQ